MKKKLIIGSLLAILLICLLFAKINIRASLDMLLSLDIRFLFFCTIFYFGAHLFRALRFSVLLGERDLPLAGLVSVTIIHNLLTQFMPGRIGEGSYPLLLKKIGGVSYSKGISSLLLSRSYDLITFLTLVSIFLVSAGLGHSHLFPLKCALYCLIIVLFLVAFKYTENIILLLLMAAGKIIDLLSFRIAKAVVFNNKFAQFKEEFKGITDGRRLIRLAIYSQAAWVLTFATFYLFIWSLDKSVGFARGALGSTGAVFSSLLPISAPGAIGTLETGWTLGFVIVGVNKEVALASGLLMHAFIFVFGGFFSLMGLLVLKGVAKGRTGNAGTG